MRCPASLHLLIFGVIAAPVSAFAQQSLALSLASQQLITAGAEVYQRNCAGCHGIEAKGDGPASKMLSPRPRNLVAGSFKFRSTPTGTLPVIGDLIRTIDQGVLGTSMPSFRLMSEREKLAVATYVMSLRPDWAQSQGDPIFIPRPPKGIFESKETLLVSAARGKKIYAEVCLTCHGSMGLGDGPGSEGLVDGEEQPLKPANFQKKWIKSGRTPSDVYKAITTGLDGTPMPGFAEAYNDAQRWDLAAYVFYLRGVGAKTYAADLLEKQK